MSFEFAKAFPDVHYIGQDISKDIIEAAQAKHAELGVTNTSFVSEQDLVKIGTDIDLVGSLQVLNIVDYHKGLEIMKAKFALARRGVFVMSLFTDSKLEFMISVIDNHRDETVPYNIHSVYRIQEIARTYGFTLVENVWFQIPADLPRPTEPGRGTYTRTLADGTRLQFSDCLHMPWKLLYFEKVTPTK